MLTHFAHEPKLIEIAAQGEEDGIEVRMSQGLAESTLDILGATFTSLLLYGRWIILQKLLYRLCQILLLLVGLRVRINCLAYHASPNQVVAR